MNIHRKISKNMKKRKVAFYSIILQGCENVGEMKACLINLLPFIHELRPIDRKEDLTTDRFCFLDDLQISDTGEYNKLLFKSARHSYRAPLLDRDTIGERDNPKKITEGEQMKTHAVIRYFDDFILLVLEQGSNCMTSGNIARYLNRFLLKFNHKNPEQAIGGTFILQPVFKENFIEQLQTMNRVMKAVIYTDKRILGSDSLNYMERTSNVKEEVSINLSVKRGASMKDAILDAWNKLVAGRTEITRIRVEGEGEHDEKTVINTEQFAKIEYMEVNQNEDTGEFVTPEVFNWMMLIAQRYV